MKYLLGQTLNSTAEVLQALLDGHNIIVPNGTCSIGLIDGEFVFTSGDLKGQPADPTFRNPGWRIFTPETTRCIAVMPGSANEDGCFWLVANSEEEARSLFPEAKAYHTVTLGVPNECR